MSENTQRADISAEARPVISRDLPCGTIVIDQISKRFKKHTILKKSYSTLKSTLLSKIFTSRYPEDNYLEALKSISIRVDPGQALGLIGKNGSGKSTLLKIISGIYRPDSGSVTISGRLSALIELGAGFHPDFSGRENVYLGGAMFGLKRAEVDKIFNKIVAYAELEDFIDDPVRTYSSGMYMRLGFSLAIHTDPDVLLVDEVLAVGDAGFIHKCHDSISELKRKGKTLIFVTHDLSAVTKWCDEVIWLDKGEVRRRGNPKLVVDAYLNEVDRDEDVRLQKEATQELEQPIDVPDGHKSELQRWGNKRVILTDVKLFGADGAEKRVFQDDDEFTAVVAFETEDMPEDVVFGISILRFDGFVVFGTNTDIDEHKFTLPTGKSRGEYRFKLPRLGLVEGSYFLDVATHSSEGVTYDYHHHLHKFSVRTGKGHHGVYSPIHTWSVR